MAIIKKTLFPKNLDRYAVLVTDTEPNSRYFKISELPDTFTGGKNAFLIAGSEDLVADTKIQIELRDSAGNIIYHEPGEGMVSSSINGESFVTEYYEGVSKVVAVYVYPDTAYGPCTLTILGELNQYVDGNGITTPIPLDWENKYNVKWQKTINVNPSLSNTTKIRFYRRPQVTIKEILSPIYRIESGSKVNSGVSQSFADIKLSQLETFAGDVKRVKVFRTSEGDISDYNLIQDILVESKELLTTFNLSGSVVGQTGTFTSETLQNYWNTGSLKAELTSSRVESGVKLSGSGYFTYTQSLDIRSANTYELNLDAFYSSSTSSNLGIYLSYVSQSTTFTSSIASLAGTQPTKNLLDTVIPFQIDRDYPSASLYFSQSRGEWHLGNISLGLSQDTAFSPDEISFITTMPTVIGDETYNFKFEFYDVNNNYVPVAVTQSATFTGGTVGVVDIDFIISSSVSQSLDVVYSVSSSISGTMTVYSSSASSSVGTLSGSVSASITSLSSSVSSSNAFILSSSLSKVQQLANGQYSGSFIGDTVIYSPVIGGQQGYISEKFQVGNTTPIILDARTSTRKIYIGGVNDTGSYNSGSTSVYMDSTGKFSLKDKLTWDGTTLNIDGNINIAGGSAATSINNINNSVSFINTATSSLNNSVSFINTATSSLQTQINTADDKIFTNALGRIIKTPSTGTQAGLYLGNTNLGYYNGTAWKTYMDNTGLFYLTGSANGNALLWDGSALTIRGTIKVGGGEEVTSTTISNAASALQSGQTGKSLGLTGGSVGGVTIASTKIYVGTGDFGSSNTGFYVDSSGQMSLKDKLIWDGTTLTITGKVVITDGNAATTSSLASGLAGKINTGGAASDVNSGTTTISGGKITADSINATQISALNFTGKTANFNQGTVGGWTLADNLIYNTNVEIDNSNSRIDFKSGGVVKTRIKSGNADIGTFTTTPITIAAGTTNTNTQLGSTISPGPLVVQSSSGGNTAEATFTAPAGANGLPFSLTVPYPALSSVGFSSVSNLGTGVSWDWSYYARLDYVIRLNNGSGTLVASGNKVVASGAVSTNILSPGSVTYPGFAAGTMIIPNVGTASSGQVYWISVTLGTNVTTRINPSGATPIGSSGTATSRTDGWTSATGNAGLLAVQNRAEYATNGAQIGSSEGTFVALGDAAGTGYVGAFNGNVQVIGVLTAGSVSASDIRAKTNIQPISNGIETIKKLNPVKFDWLQHITGNNEFEKGYGFIADDVKNVLPDLVYQRKGYQFDDFKHLEYNSFHAIAIKAIQELTEKVEKLEAQISSSI